MALALELGDAGFDPERLNTQAEVTLDADALAITGVDLSVEGAVPEADEATFRECADAAADDCPVSKALAGTDVSVTATLA